MENNAILSNKVDLHTHSNCSDGTYTPSELVDYAVKKGLSAIALTDHDTIDGVEEAIERGRFQAKLGHPIKVIPGIEFSTEWGGRDVHIVGLFIDYRSDYFKGRLKHFVASRNKRNAKMCQKLTEHGMPVSLEELEEEFPNCILTRAHYARFLYNHAYVKSIKEAFDRFLGDGKCCHIPRKKISPMRAVEIIRRSGGFPVLAHPVLYGFSKDKLEELVKRLSEMGLGGIEAVYSTYTPSDERDIRKLASKYSLCISGGSDFHGTNKPDIDLADGKGHLFVPESVLSDLENAHKEMLKNNMDFSIPKILFTDLDGTLLKNDKSISAYTYDVLKKWTKKGNHIALSTGRDICSANMVCRDLGLDALDNIYTIGFNGGLIYDYHKETMIHRVTLAIEDVAYLVEKAKEYGLYIQTYQDDCILAPTDSEELAYYKRVIKTPVVISSDIVSKLSIAPCKCLAISLHNSDTLEQFRRDSEEYAREHGITMLYSNPYYLEIIPSSSGKGSAVKKLCEYLDIKGLLSVGAGDQENDMSMLMSCDIAIAMENGIDKLKDMCTLLSEDTNEKDGLAKTLETIM